MYTIFLN